MPEPTLQAPAGVHFTCTQCGECCRAGWAIVLGDGERERLAALDWAGKGDDLAGEPPIVPIKIAGGRTLHRLRLRADRACAYLGERNQCRIHEHFGEAAKPLTCRLFPYSFHRVGGHVGVSVSFACRAVSGAIGRPVAEALAELDGLFTESDPPQFPRHVFAGKVRIPGDLLWDLEHEAIAFLLDEEFPLAARVAGLGRWLAMMARGNPLAPGAAEFRGALAAGVRKRLREQPCAPEVMTGPQRTYFLQWLYAAMNPPVDIEGADRERHAAIDARRMEEAHQFSTGEGRVFLSGRALAPSLGEVRAIARGFLDTAAASRVGGTWLAAKVLGQQFLRSREGERAFVPALDELCLYLAAWVFVSKALAAERGAPAVEERDARSAIRELDLGLGHIELPTKGAHEELREIFFAEGELAARAAAEM